MTEKTYEQMCADFDQAYRTKIVPMVQESEAERNRMLAEANKISSIWKIIFVSFSLMLIFILAVVLFVWYKYPRLDLFVIFSIPFFFLIVIEILLALAPSICKGYFEKLFETKIKEKIMSIVCACFGDLKWSHSSYQDGKLFEKSKVIPSFTSETYDDIFVGSYKNIPFEIVEALYSSPSKKNSNTILFYGVIVKLKMNKNFNSHTVIMPNDSSHTSPCKSLKHTVLEDVEFEAKYDVFTNDPVDARYLITPSFMERLKNIKTAFCAYSISCAFYEKNLFIALNTSDLFSLNLFDRPVDDAKQYFTMYEEIVSIIKLIDYFKLNQNVGL